MKISVAFDVKNHVEVMESWPIIRGNMTFFLERENNLVKRVVLRFSNVGIENAPKMVRSSDTDDIPSITIRGEEYAQLAISQILSWQAVVSGLQIFDLDFDDYEMRFHPENMDEEDQIHIKSFRSSNNTLKSTCEFEQIGRGFCVGNIPLDRIEYTSHYREGRLALDVGRNIDAYNNMFLFLETRYCDGKTKTAQQVDLLLKSQTFVDSFEKAISELANKQLAQSKHLKDVFDESLSIRDKIKSIVNLRGKLRHHSLKSPFRWDPNKQGEYEEPARFLSSVVADIVIKESLRDIYAPENLDTFRDLSVSSGFESIIKVQTYRLENKRTLELNMSFPTTVVSSKLCLVALRNALEECEKNTQIGDTTRLDATNDRNGLELFETELGLWAYTDSQSMKSNNPADKVRCRFEHFQSGIVIKHEFIFPIQVNEINIENAWGLLKHCFDRIENIDPTTRVMNLKLFLGEIKRPILTYRVGAQVIN